jgi:hypothetical protein
MRLSPQTWAKLRKVESQHIHFDAMRERLGIHEITAARLNGGTAVATARRACVSCRHDQACKRWLDASIVLEAPPVFCPNTAFFDTCCTAQALLS